MSNKRNDGWHMEKSGTYENSGEWLVVDSYGTTAGVIRPTWGRTQRPKWQGYVAGVKVGKAYRTRMEAAVRILDVHQRLWGNNA